MTVPTYILAGGQSRRFGSDKARAVLVGEPLIVRLARQLNEFASEIVVVADRVDKYADLGLVTIADRMPGQGPLGGLETALTHAANRNDSRRVLLISCDMAEIRAEWVRALLDAMTQEVLASAFRGDVWHPFPGVYHADLLPLVNEYLASPKASFQRLLTDPRAHAAELPLPPDWPAVGQANTPEDLERLKSEQRRVKSEE